MRIDVTTVQLLFADAQTALVANSDTGHPDAIDAASGVLIDCAGILDLPITISAVREGDAPPTLLRSIGARIGTADLFVRDCASPFMDAGLAARLSANDRRLLVIAGFASEVVIVHAALDAIAAGYDVHLPIDAIGGIDARTEAAVMRQIERAGGTLTSVATLVTMLAPDFAQDPGSRVIAAVRGFTA